LDKKEEILKTALKLFVEFGFHATPTSKIAKEAGIANGTLISLLQNQG
jgi:AcrR family transcriptional regulator